MSTILAYKPLGKTNRFIYLCYELIVYGIWHITGIGLLKDCVSNYLENMNQGVFFPIWLLFYAGYKAHVALTNCAFPPRKKIWQF